MGKPRPVDELMSLLRRRACVAPTQELCDILVEAAEAIEILEQRLQKAPKMGEPYIRPPFVVEGDD